MSFVDSRKLKINNSHSSTYYFFFNTYSLSVGAHLGGGGGESPPPPPPQRFYPLANPLVLVNDFHFRPTQNLSTGANIT